MTFATDKCECDKIFGREFLLGILTVNIFVLRLTIIDTEATVATCNLRSIAGRSIILKNVEEY
jgi:hypothetical protein